MTGHAAACVEKYLELSGQSVKLLPKVTHPCIDDHQLVESDYQNKGNLHASAARIVLKCLFVSRDNRPETLWAVNHLSRNVTKWARADDKRLHRLIAFIHHNPECIQFGFVGDNLCDCYLTLFCDAGFAGDLQDSKSTGGWFLFLCGPRTWVPICWSFKKQGAVSHSSTEAEIITLEGGIRMDGIPAIMLLEKVMQVM